MGAAVFPEVEWITSFLYYINGITFLQKEVAGGAQKIAGTGLQL